MTTRTVADDRWYLLREGRRTGPGELEREIAVTTGAELTPPSGQLLVGRYGGRAGVLAYGCWRAGAPSCPRGSWTWGCGAAGQRGRRSRGGRAL